MPQIHPTAIVDTSAEIGDGVEIGPFSVVGPDVKIGDGSSLLSHVVLEGRTTLGPIAVFIPSRRSAISRRI